MTATATKLETKPHVLITGGDPDALVQDLVPTEDAFERELELDPNAPDFDADADPPKELLDYLPADALERIGNALVRQLPEFESIRLLNILYFWKREGGAEAGQPCLGALKRPLGLERQLTEHVDEHGRTADFILWLAADTLRDTQLAAWQLERHIHHQLCHAGIHSKTGSPRIKPHEVEMFVGEYERYGWATPPQKRLGKAVNGQLGLFDDEDGDDDAE